MKIYGLNKTTLLDYPERLAATIFTGGCNFRCPFCHNSDLVLMPPTLKALSDTYVLDFLHKRKGILTGVCITGGEPTLQPDLTDYIILIKSMGYLVKLDTNGYNPDILIRLAEAKLIDYIAMDIKGSYKNYGTSSGIINMNMAPIIKSVEYLKHSQLHHEFRTTVVEELHNEEDIRDIGIWLEGNSPYYIQPYRESENILFPGSWTSPSKDRLNNMLITARTYLPNAALRGDNL